jgi:hypothetical protein
LNRVTILSSFGEFAKPFSIFINIAEFLSILDQVYELWHRILVVGLVDVRFSHCICFYRLDIKQVEYCVVRDIVES